MLIIRESPEDDSQLGISRAILLDSCSRISDRTFRLFSSTSTAHARPETFGVQLVGLSAWMVARPSVVGLFGTQLRPVLESDGSDPRHASDIAGAFGQAGTGRKVSIATRGKLPHAVPEA